MRPQGHASSCKCQKKISSKKYLAARYFFQQIVSSIIRNRFLAQVFLALYISTYKPDILKHSRCLGSKQQHATAVQNVQHSVKCKSNSLTKYFYAKSLIRMHLACNSGFQIYRVNVRTQVRHIEYMYIEYMYLSYISSFDI